MSQDTVIATPKYKIECRKPLFFDNFADGVADQADWSEDAGNWVVSSQTQYDGDTGYIYGQDQTGADYITTTKDLLEWTDYYAVVAFKILTASASVGLCFRKTDGTYYAFKITQGSSNNLKLEKEDGTQIGSLASQTINQNTWYIARIRCSGTSLACDISTDFETFTEKISTTDSTYTSGFAAFKTYAASAYFDEVEVYELEKSITEADNVDLVSFNIFQSTSTQADVFALILQNVSGTNTDLFQPGWEIHAWAGYKENTPDLNKLFIGVIERPTPSLDDSSGDVLQVTGKDYITELLSQPVTEVYYNKDVDWIVKDLISKYCKNVKAGINVQATSNTLERIAFKHKSLFECLKELALEGGGGNKAFDFWIDVKRELYFQQKGITSSGKTLTVGINILAQNFGPSIDDVYDTIRVFGKGKPDDNNVVQQLTEDTTFAFGKDTTYERVAQTFILGATQLFDVVVKPITSTGSPTADIVFEVQEVDGSNLPNGTVLATYIVRNDVWEQAITDTVDITVALDADIDPTKTYAIVMYTKENVLDDSNHYNLRENSAGGYGSGARLYYNGSIWTGSGDGNDLYFKLFPRLPNVIELENETIIQNYKINKTYEDLEKIEEIRNYDECKKRADYIYKQKTTVPYEGNITTLGLDDVRAGQTIIVVIPNSNINAAYEMIGLTQIMDKRGYTSTVYLNTKMETFSDILAAHEKRIRQLEAKDIIDDERATQIKGLDEILQITNDPGNNLTMQDRTINTDTWNFGDLASCAFSKPIIFGGGSGKYGSNRIADASD